MSTTAVLTAEERAFLLDEIIRPGSSGHNNHHFARDGGPDEAMMRTLLARGLVYRTRQHFAEGGWIYHVTLTGRQALDAARAADNARIRGRVLVVCLTAYLLLALGLSMTQATAGGMP